MGHTIVHFEIPADDPQRAIDFYSKLFGWRIEQMAAEGDMAGVEYWGIKTTDAEYDGSGGGLMRRMAPGQQITNYIEVESVDQFNARAQELGAEVLMPKMAVGDMGWFSQLKDPEGNVFAFWETNTATEQPTPNGNGAQQQAKGHKVVHFEIPADDLERASRFYKELLGWKIEKDTSMEGVEYWMIQTNGSPGTGVGGGLMQRQHPGQQIVNYVGVESVDQYVDRARELGGDVVVPKMDVGGFGWMAHLKDPEGNAIALWQDNPDHAAGGNGATG
jgi:uncharacterized protein